MELTTIITDLQITPGIIIPPPYGNDIPLEECFKIVYKELQRSTRRKDRIMSLTNAFYLGKLLDEVDDRVLLRKYSQKLTEHYYRISRNTFELFKDSPGRIVKTKLITVQMIRRLKRPELDYIQEELFEFLVGAQNLEEENC